jgi:hypothetical protein
VRRKRQWSDLLLLFAVVCLSASMAWRAQASRRPVEPPPPPILAAGERVPEFWRDLGWSAPPTGPSLVVFYTAECPFCRISVRRWNELHQAAVQMPGVRTVAVGLSDTTASLAYPAQTGLRYPIHLPRDGKAMEARWKVRAVPYTVLLEPDGRVRGAWRGYVDSARHAVISRSLHGESASPLPTR